MAISLQKGGNVNLSKEAPGLTSLKVALGWDVRATDGAAFDLDGAVFLLNSSGKVRSDSDFIFYNNLKSADGSIVHSGDNTTGAGEGDDEFVTIDLTKVPADVDKVVLGVTIQSRYLILKMLNQLKPGSLRVSFIILHKTLRPISSSSKGC